jgi:hypothetical protein
MAQIIRVKPGLQVAQDGTYPELRGGRKGSLTAQDIGGRYEEATYRGLLYTLDAAAYTIVAGNAPGQALGTALFIVGVWNPPNSGKNLSILRVSSGHTSGTPGGPLVYEFVPNMSLVSSTPTGTIQSAFLGSAVASVAKAMNGVILAVLPADTTTTTKRLGMHGGPAAVAAGAGNYGLTDEVAGAIIVPPATLFGLGATAAGTTDIVGATIWWEEIPL